MKESTPVAPTPKVEENSLEAPPETVQSTGSLFEKEGTEVRKDIPFKMDTGHLIRGTLLIIVITLLLIAMAFYFFRSEIEKAALLPILKSTS